MSVVHLPFNLPGPHDSVIRADLRLPAGPADELPLVVLCHGFKGFKDWGFFPFIAERLASGGLAVITMNFSHNGVGADLQNFTELDRFKANTFALELEDLQRVLSAARDRKIPEAARLNLDRIGLIGHSRGAAAVIAAGAQAEPGVRAVVSLAGISRTLPAYLNNEELREEWKRAGVHYVVNSRTGQQLPLGVQLLEELERRPRAIEEDTGKLECPLLIVHGDADTSVPVTAAHELSSWAKHPEPFIVPGGDHTFGAVHPFAGTTKELNWALDIIWEFLDRKLKDGMY